MRRLLTCAILAIAASPVLATPPNVIVILADDMGYSDVGSFGSEISTPTLDRLADKGLRVRRFYNSAKCVETRSSLLSGRHWQTVGPGIQKGKTVAEHLQEGGYHTIAAGKWHLQGEPTERGFDRYFGHLSGATSYFRGDGSFRRDGEEFNVPAEGFYTTTAFAEYAIEALEANEDQPFFLYLAFNAPHSPLQALPEDKAKYDGRYAMGWDTLREQRHERQIKLGVVDAAAPIPPRPATIPAWETLSDEEQAFEANRMAAYAALVDRMDQAIGQIVEHLEATDQLDNTLILFLSDNGASPYDRTPRPQNPLERVPHNVGLGWAWATNTPFRDYKRNMTNGGHASPLIAHWPAVITTGGNIIDGSGHIIDIAPTLLDLAGVETAVASDGVSLRPMLAGEVWPPERPLFFQFVDHRAVIDSDMKLVSNWGRPWMLFDLKADPAEANDLAAEREDEVDRLKKLYEGWAAVTPQPGVKNSTPEPAYRPMDVAGEVFVE